jgi:gamma-glutamyltranspeptidase / glutathione hydrolase
LRAAVTASTQEAADAGAAVLRAGGNAVDAAVASALASCVADPCNVGLGGYGGYMVVQRPGETADCVAFPVSPPPSINHADFAKSAATSGPGRSTVPNVVAGLAKALDVYGTLAWPDISAGAIGLARDGVTANDTTRRAFALHRSQPFIAECFELEDSGQTTAPVLRFRQPLLADTLEELAHHGPAWFYAGPLADAAATAWRAAGLALRPGEWRTQVDGVFVEPAARWETEGVQLYSAPLGLSGSACLFAFLEAAARISKRTSSERPESLTALALAMAGVWQHRFATERGNDFAEVSLKHWIDAALERVPDEAVLPMAAEHTSHLNAVDASGMAAALTFTHGPTWFGGQWALPGTGVLMNAGMQNCASSGVLQRGSRWYGVSNMCPTIVDRPGLLRVAIGCPGARRIPSNIALALTRLLHGGHDLQASVAAGRFHAENRDCVTAELDRIGVTAVKALEHRFASVRPEIDDNYYGPLTAVSFAKEGAVEAAMDDRAFKGFCAFIE